MTQRVLCTTFILVFLFISGSVHAQTGMAKLKQRLDDLKPKGTLIKQIFQFEKSEPKPAYPRIRQPKPAPTGQYRVPTLNPQSRKSNQSVGKAQSIQLAPGAFQNETPKTETTVEKRAAGKPGSRNTMNASVLMKKTAPVPSEKILKIGAEFKDTTNGIVITEVAEGSAAAQAELKRDDILVRFAGMRIDDQSELYEIATALNDGDQVEIEVHRAGRQETLMLIIGSEVSQSIEPAATPETPQASEIDELRKIVQQQQKTITGLRKQLENTRENTAIDGTPASEIPLAK